MASDKNDPIVDPSGETIDTTAATAHIDRPAQDADPEADEATVDHDAAGPDDETVDHDADEPTATLMQGADAPDPDPEADAPTVPDDEAAAPAPPPPSGLASRLAAFHLANRPDNFAFALTMSVAAAMLLPFLGSMGFFDPWESHYGEVARSMAERDDYLYPYWKDSYFFSKPVLLFWLTGPLYKLIGAGDATGELPAAVELVGRLPIALFALFTVACVWFSTRRLLGRRAATIAGIVLATTPFFAFIGRQAITDMLYVGPMSSAICLLTVAFFDDETRDRWKDTKIPWPIMAFFAVCLLPQLWEIGRSGAFLNRVTTLGSEFATRLAFSLLLVGLGVGALALLRRKCGDPLIHLAAALVALATLGKGPHAVAFTGMPFFLYFVVSGEWRLLKRPALLTGIGLYLLIASPWFIVMALFDGKDGGRKVWYQRYILYDLFGRLGGVHGERGTHEYYVRYFAFGTLPWTPFAVLSVFDALRKRLKREAERTPADRYTLLVGIWAVSLFAFFSVTETKFHHYIFPVVIPSAILIGRFLDETLRARHRMPVGFALICFFVIAVVARDLAREPWQLADLFSYHYVSYKPSYYFPQDWWWHIAIGVMAGIAAGLVLLGVASDWAAERVALLGDGALSGESSSSAVPSTRTAGPTPAWLNLLASVSYWGRGAFAGFGTTPSGGFVFASLLGAFLWCTFTTHVYQPQASQHWSHRQLLHTYWEMKEPGDVLVSYQMDWKGETFYSHNTEQQIKKSGSQLKKTVEKPGRTFVLVQQDRFKRIESAVGKQYKEHIKVIDRSNTKWFLVLVTDP
jgi:4-amino-4-deoxy-L-arabinose transferase-like glycosyltransferase